VVSTRIDWVREHCHLLRAVSSEFGRTRPFDGLAIGTGWLARDWAALPWQPGVFAGLLLISIVWSRRRAA